MNIQLHLYKEDNIKKLGEEFVTLPLDTYINGCVAQEVGNSDIEVCKAQAIAARTNAYYYASREKIISDKSSSFQAFSATKIANSNYSNAEQASKETAGIVLAYNGKPLYPAAFSASNGGHVCSSKDRWGSDRAWLQSFDDPYDIGKKTGHGVGMSQRGAKEMAKQGFDYIQILQFYYPNTTLLKVYGEKEEDTPMTKVEQLVDWAESKVGCGYVWGATGQTLTEKSLNDLYNRYPDHVDKSIVKKWLGKQVFDCASFNVQALKAVGISVKSGATTQWKTTAWDKKGTIDTLPEDKVCLLYRAVNSSTMQHTGIYCGNGYFIDARGSNNGVVKNKLGTYAWTHWGIPKGLYDNTNIEVITVKYQGIITATSGKVNLRAGASASTSRIAQMSINDIVDILDDSNNDWWKISYNGLIGYVSTKYITKNGVEQSGKKYYVQIECESESDAKKLAAQLTGAKVAQD